MTRAAGLFAAVLCVAVLAGCGSEDFQNKPRPASALEITGVIQKDKVTISPDQFGAGPILLAISNQTEEAPTVTLMRARACASASGRRPAPHGQHASAAPTRTRAPTQGAPPRQEAGAQEIQPAELDVGESRGDSSDQLLQP